MKLFGILFNWNESHYNFLDRSFFEWFTGARSGGAKLKLQPLYEEIKKVPDEKTDSNVNGKLERTYHLLSACKNANQLNWHLGNYGENLKLATNPSNNNHDKYAEPAVRGSNEFAQAKTAVRMAHNFFDSCLKAEEENKISLSRGEEYNLRKGKDSAENVAKEMGIKL